MSTLLKSDHHIGGCLRFFPFFHFLQHLLNFLRCVRQLQMLSMPESFSMQSSSEYTIVVKIEAQQIVVIIRFMGFVCLR